MRVGAIVLVAAKLDFEPCKAQNQGQVVTCTLVSVQVEGCFKKLAYSCMTVADTHKIHIWRTSTSTMTATTRYIPLMYGAIYVLGT